MADEQTTSQPSGPPSEAEKSAGNGNGQARFVPGQQEGTRHDGHDSSKYKPPKKDEDEQRAGQAQGRQERRPARSAG